MDPEEVTAAWAGREGEFSPRYYAYRGPNEVSEAVRATLADRVPSDAAILEPGCSSGRHLAHLHDAGFEDLHGVDVNEEAFEVLAEASPELAAAGSFVAEPLQDALADEPDGRFEAAFTVETLQHVPPADDWVFGELARVVDEVLVTVENEPQDEQDRTVTVESATGGFPLYKRDWGRIFTDHGLRQVERREVGRDVLRVFEAD